MAERRAWRRYPLQLEVDFRTLGKGAVATTNGLTRDISTMGIYLSGLPESVEEGSQVDLAIRLPAQAGGRKSEVRGVGRVLRVDNRSGDKVGVAVQFVRVDLTAEELESIT